MRRPVSAFGPVFATLAIVGAGRGSGAAGRTPAAAVHRPTGRRPRAGGAMRFSVVVPAYNEAASLPAALDSLRRQDVGDDHFEIIVVDNGSDDDTPAIARSYGARVVVEPRRGVCDARQAGVDAARGEFVVSTDADTTHPRGLAAADRRRPPVAAGRGGDRRPLPLRGSALVGSGVPDDRLRAGGRDGPASAVAPRTSPRPTWPSGARGSPATTPASPRVATRSTCCAGWWRGDRCSGTPTTRSSPRLGGSGEGLLHTFVISYGYYYALSSVVNRIAGRRVIGVAPAVRDALGR